MFLGVQAELSVIALDLTMVLGVAYGLNLVFGVDLPTGVFLAAFDAVLFPVFSTLLGCCKGNLLGVYIAGFILLSYVFGVLISQPEVSFSMNGLLTKLNGESAFALMSLLGASIMPHNFYVHSSIVQQNQCQGPPNISKSALCQDHFFAIVCVFSGIFLVHHVLLNSAANVFYSTGFVLLTFPDAMSLMEQVFRNAVLPLMFLMAIFLSNQITAATWNVGGQVVLHDFLRLDIPGWLHRATIRIIAMVPALYCVWTSGAEGIYQLLILTQIMVALLLPSSVIPLFRVASSRPIMGAHKISPFEEFLALVTFMGMLILKIIFVVEMLFGSSDWVGNVRWNSGFGVSGPFIVLLIAACASFSLMLWLAATPLKSASSRTEAETWSTKKTIPEASTEMEDIDLSETSHHVEEPIPKRAMPSAPLKSAESHVDVSATSDYCLPENIMEAEQEIQLSTVMENSSDVICPSPSVLTQEELASVDSSASPVVNEARDINLSDFKTMKIGSLNPVEKRLISEKSLRIEKEDDEGDAWESEESSKAAPGSTSSLMPDGPPSLRSLSGKSEEGGSSTGSLSRLAGLGRAARRQLAAVLDEFWGQLYDFYGKSTQEARAKKFDVLLGIDTNPVSSLLRVDSTVKEHSGYVPSVGGRGSESVLSPNLYDSARQSRFPNNMESFGPQRGSSSVWSNHMQLLDAYVQNSSRNVDSGERRYSSLRAVPTTEPCDYQPATVHGYQIASYLSRIAKDRSTDYLNSQMDSSASKSPSLGPTNFREPPAFPTGQNLQNGMSSVQPSAFQNLGVPRNNLLQSERSYYDICSSGSADTAVLPASAKKYHSLPDMSGLSIPQRDLYTSDKSSQWDSSIGYGSLVGRTNYDTLVYSNMGSRAGAPLAFDELSPSKGYKSPFPLQFSSSSDTRSLWSRQPFEQFGVAKKDNAAKSEGTGSGSNVVILETVDSEAKLLQSFRYCIIKLLKLEGSDWLFRQNDGADEDLIDRVAARENFLYEVETREINQAAHMGEALYVSSGRRYGAVGKSDEAGHTNMLISSVPHCGDGCIWRADLIVSFGVWCIHRILDLSLMESRPELWGKYTYVLNRLQGVIDPAFSKPRSPKSPCFCLQIPAAFQQRFSPPVSNGMLPPAAKPGRGKCTNAPMLLDLIKDVEIAISCRKGRTGTAAGDVAFPMGKENLASVLKRYKRRLSNKPVGEGSRKAPPSAAYSS